MSLVGESLGKYRILDMIGQGGMGIVYRAHHPGLGVDVAIKILNPDQLRNPEALARFQRECQTLARVRVEGLVPVQDNDTYEGQPYYVMPFITDPTLAEDLATHEARGPYPVNRALQVTMSLLRTLDRLHRQQVIHRDLKPENIFVADDGRTLITDFGLARDVADRNLTRTGTALGTILWMAPEQLQAGAPDAQTDLYQVGLILYRMLGGDLPYAPENLSQAVAAKCTQRYLPPVTRAAEPLEAGLVAFVRRLTASRPQDRFPDAASAAGELEPMVPDRGPAPPRARIVRPPPAPRLSVPRQPTSRLVKLGLPAAALALGTLIAGGMVWLAVRRPAPVQEVEEVASVAVPSPGPQAGDASRPGPVTAASLPAPFPGTTPPTPARHDGSPGSPPPHPGGSPGPPSAGPPDARRPGRTPGAGPAGASGGTPPSVPGSPAPGGGFGILARRLVDPESADETGDEIGGLGAGRPGLRLGALFRRQPAEDLRPPGASAMERVRDLWPARPSRAEEPLAVVLATEREDPPEPSAVATAIADWLETIPAGTLQALVDDQALPEGLDQLFREARATGFREPASRDRLVEFLVRLNRDCWRLLPAWGSLRDGGGGGGGGLKALDALRFGQRLLIYLTLLHPGFYEAAGRDGLVVLSGIHETHARFLDSMTMGQGRGGPRRWQGGLRQIGTILKDNRDQLLVVDDAIASFFERAESPISPRTGGTTGEESPGGP